MSSAAVDEREINERHGVQPLETYKSVRSLRYCCNVYMGVEAGWTGSVGVGFLFWEAFPPTSAHVGAGRTAKPDCWTRAHAHARRIRNTSTHIYINKHRCDTMQKQPRLSACGRPPQSETERYGHSGGMKSACSSAAALGNQCSLGVTSPITPASRESPALLC